jgi:Mrp family chromosome partitioning ATPase
MGRIQSALGKAQREAAKAKAEAGNGGAAAQAAEVRRSGPRHEQVEAVRRPDLFKHARDVVLEPRTLQMNRIRGIESSDPGAASYKMLRTRILQRMRSHGWHKLTVTSPRANAGKTLTSINLAISLAHEPNQEVILVDLDLRNPRVATYLGLDSEFGVADHLTRDVPIEKVLLKPNIPRLYVIPGTKQMENSSELLASPQMRVFTQTLVSSSPSTIVIFDLPPLLEADDMLTFMPQVDAVLFVVAQRETRLADLEKSNELFKDLNLLGTVLNKSSDEAPTDYY